MYSGRPLHYIINMDVMIDNMLVHPLLSIHTYGDPITLPAKISNGILLDGNGQYILIESQSDDCISSISRCYQHGLTVSMWTKFRRLENGMFYFTTGNGIKVYALACAVSFVITELQRLNFVKGERIKVRELL